ncbi:MAG: hypothetical protein AAFP79_10175 [Pseudomonadota bacterium]
MDAELFMIFSFIVTMTIIIGLTVNAVVKKVLDYKREKNAMLARPKTGTPEITHVAERTDHIEDRLKVLERIATDPEARRGADLADEIEQLRIEQKQKELG